MKKDKQKIKAYIDSPDIEVYGTKSVDSGSKRKALKELKDKADKSIIKALSERGVAAEKEGNTEELKKILKKIKMLKSE